MKDLIKLINLLHLLRYEQLTENHLCLSVNLNPDILYYLSNIIGLGHVPSSSDFHLWQTDGFAGGRTRMSIKEWPE